MNRRMVVYRIGQLLLLESVLMIIPLAVSAGYGEWNGVLSFAVAIGTALFFGIIPLIFFRPENDVMYAKEGCKRGAGKGLCDPQTPRDGLRQRGLAGAKVSDEGVDLVRLHLLCQRSAEIPGI